MTSRVYNIDKEAALLKCKEELESFGVSINILDVVSNSRDSRAVFQRSLVAWYLCKIMKFSLSETGFCLNRRHCSILHLTNHYRPKCSELSLEDKEAWKAIVHKAPTINARKKIKFHRSRIKQLEAIIKKQNKLHGI